MNTLVMYDTLDPDRIPIGIDSSIIIAAYKGHSGNPQSYAQAVARFPGHRVVSITTKALDPTADILDVEPEAEEPSDHAGIQRWIETQRARNRIGTLYCNTSTKPGVFSRITGTAPWWWEANWNGPRAITPGAAGLQFWGSNHANPVGAYDQSYVTQAWLDSLSIKPVPHPVPVPTPHAGYYTVQRGDTLSGIASRYHTTWQVLQGLNHLANPNLIYAGQHIILPGATPSHPLPPAPAPGGAGRYTVKTGDTLTSIAARYTNPAITWQTLAHINHIANPNVIYAGQVLIIG